jgi:uncharacterized protein with ATP-grasp and redox domains
MSNLPSNRPIPEPLRGSDLGTFAHRSVVERLPEIGRRTIAENEFSPEILLAFEALIREIPDALIRPLNDAKAPDAQAWESYLDPFIGLDWLQVPWFFAEFYFYRRILEATGYFRSENREFQKDPFHLQKIKGIRTAQRAIDSLNHVSEGPDDQVLERLLNIDLWSNRADLSMWPVDEVEESALDLMDSRHLLINQATSIAEHMRQTMMRMDLILDNVGYELVADLFLAEYILSHDLTDILILHPKAYPIFVSDVIAGDLYSTLDILGGFENTSETSLRLDGYLKEGRLRVKDDLFWTSPLALWEMPESMRQDFAGSDLVLFKGDMNYRRLLGDRHWPIDTAFEAVMDYFPAPVAALRTSKSEVACGLNVDLIEQVAAEDPDWMINGQWGMIQFRG